MLRHLLCATLPVCVLFAAETVPVQHQGAGPRHVEASNTHVRMLAVVPLVGTGKPEDPIRPDYVPLPPVNGAKADINGILGFAIVMADDHKHALVELVARNRAAFKDILADKRADVKVFEKGKDKQSDIETEFRKYKSDFRLNQLFVRIP